MHNDYSDLIGLVKKKPIWWDNNAVPRFSLPTCSPKELRKLYCQECRREFWIKITDCYSHIIVMPFKDKELKEPLINRDHVGLVNIKDVAEPFYWHFGDPPFHREDEVGNLCSAGYCMNSIPDWEKSAGA